MGTKDWDCGRRGGGGGGGGGGGREKKGEKKEGFGGKGRLGTWIWDFGNEEVMMMEC